MLLLKPVKSVLRVKGRCILAEDPTFRVGTNNELESLELVMATQSVVLDTPIITGERTAYHERLAQPEPLLRQALGLALRAFRADKGVTLRELAKAARVSPGYISELERGRKEVSSELLASVCHALNATVADVLIEAAGNMAMTSVDQELAKASPAAAEPVSEL
ncbi:hypothetical protein HMPREF1292_01496 [Corynebacterium sp. KPL1995]|nr:hypothetical protein HMPREF1292_01496 [Corynebacterium sp. KPL1995]ERS71668.1 hypothetical protein HMPREF1290_01502 [Corynebacterium sp. KPL1989]